MLKKRDPLLEFQKAPDCGQELLVYMEDYLNQLLDKLNEYKSIVNYRMEYIFEDDSVISFKFKQTDLPMLVVAGFFILKLPVGVAGQFLLIVFISFIATFFVYEIVICG